ncbi:MAG: hypothetical protein FPO08_07970 [Geobacter sp.]|nr:MAG: hypothetical protein FPO08_07970 [Geobacter sp.]
MITDKDKKEYLTNMFGHIWSSKKQQEAMSRALTTALDIRKFEIDLYWKRAQYFWVFIAASFAGYFWTMQQSETTEQIDNMTFVINCLGITTTWAWHLVLRGSKYWQENWEAHVDYLEDEFQGKLYKFVKSGKDYTENGEIFFTQAYPFSVSKINILLSIYAFILWLLLLVWFFIEKPQISISTGSVFIRISCFCMMISFFGCAKYYMTNKAEKIMSYVEKDFVSRNELESKH